MHALKKAHALHAAGVLLAQVGNKVAGGSAHAAGGHGVAGCGSCTFAVSARPVTPASALR